MCNEYDTHPMVVAGAGTMGHGIALLMARAGHRVTLLDIREETLSEALERIQGCLHFLTAENELPSEAIYNILSRIQCTTDMEQLQTGRLVIEAVSEDQEIKKSLYHKVAEICSQDTVLASNTSYLDVFSLAPEKIQDRMLITHFFAPPYLIPLVEIVKGPRTSQQMITWIFDLLKDAGQQPIVLDRFIPGFIVNRLQRAMGREIFHLIEGGYASPEGIDKAVLASIGIRLPVLGVVRRFDFTGLDLMQKILSNPSIGLVDGDPKTPTLDKHVAQGHLGVKSGKGFYEYSETDVQQVYSKRDRLLLKMRRLMQEIKDTLWEGAS